MIQRHNIIPRGIPICPEYLFMVNERYAPKALAMPFTNKRNYIGQLGDYKNYLDFVAKADNLKYNF